MRKFLYSMVLLPFFIGGCSHIKITPMMCNKIYATPNATVPKECRQYNKKAAYKAYDNGSSKNTTTKPTEIFKVNGTK